MAFLVEPKRTELVLQRLKDIIIVNTTEAHIVTPVVISEPSTCKRKRNEDINSIRKKRKKESSNDTDISRASLLIHDNEVEEEEERVDEIEKQIEQCEIHVRTLCTTLAEYLQVMTSALCCLKTLKRDINENSGKTQETGESEYTWFSEWAMHFLSMRSVSNIHTFLLKSKHGLKEVVPCNNNNGHMICIKEEHSIYLEQLRSLNLKQILMESGHIDCDDGGYIIHSCGYDKCGIRHSQRRGADEGGSVEAFCPKCDKLFSV